MNRSKIVKLFVFVGVLAIAIAWGISSSSDVIFRSIGLDYEIVQPTAYVTYTSKELGLSITYPETVQVVSSNDNQLIFSLLPLEDPKQQSNVGPMSVLTIDKNGPAPNGPPSFVDNESGIRKLIFEKVGPYGGELHRIHYFIDYDISAHYVVSSSTKVVFEQMLRTVSFLSTREIVLTDGEELHGGVFRDAPVVGGLKFFNSNALGVSFSYPEDHLLFVYEKLLPNEYSISITPKEATLDAIERARAGSAGEGPPSIYISFIPVDLSVSTETWVRTDSRSGFDPTLLLGEQQQKNIPKSIVIAGVPALAYHGEGLYWVDYLAFRHRQWIVVVSAASNDIPPNPNLKPIIESLKLNNAL